MKRWLAGLGGLLGAEAVLGVAATWSLPGPEVPLESRFGPVVGLAGACVALGLSAFSKTRLQRIAAGAAVAWCLAAAVFCGSAVVVNLACLVILAGSPAAIALGVREVWSGAGRGRRALAALVAAALAASWVTTSLAVGFVAVGVASTRAFHLLSRKSAHPEREIEFQSRDGLTLRGTYTPGSGSRAVLLVHGVVDGRSRMQPLADRFADAGFHVLRIDQRAHGRSDGVVCSYGIREQDDLVRAWQWLAAQPGVRAEDGVLLGTSMGGAGVLRAAGAASRLGVSRVVALAPASDFEALLQWRLRWLGPLRALVRAGVNLRLQAVGVVPPWTDRSPAERFQQEAQGVPLLVVHGDVDSTVPYAHSVALTARLQHQVLRRAAGTRHGLLPDAVAADPGHWEAIRSFVGEPLAR